MKNKLWIIIVCSREEWGFSPSSDRKLLENERKRDRPNYERSEVIPT